MEKAGYRYIDSITSDVMFEAYGKDLKELFSNAAKALFNVICQTEKIEKKETVIITVEGEDPKDLLYNWLQELIASVDIEEIFFSECTIKEASETHITAICYGEPITPEKGETVVKAVTNYGLEFEKTEEGFRVKVCCDI